MPTHVLLDNNKASCITTESKNGRPSTFAHLAVSANCTNILDTNVRQFKDIAQQLTEYILVNEFTSQQRKDPRELLFFTRRWASVCGGTRIKNYLG